MDCYITKLHQPVSHKSVALEDSIMKKDVLVTAGSNILENFTAPFDSTVVERLLAAGFEISGKTKMNEFGLRNLFENEEQEISGSTQAVLENSVPYCLCNDFMGQYRNEAAENGLCYIHPTYGTVSRYGLIPMAASMDQIGVLCRDLTEGFSLLGKIAGADAKDGAMFPEETYSYIKEERDITLGAPSHIIKQADEKTQAAIKAFAEKFTTVEEEIKYFDLYKQVLYILSCAEISNNINRYDGVKFGYRSPNSNNLENLYTKTRTEAFGLETKLTAIMGAVVLSAEQYEPYYEKAMKIRRLMKESLPFDKYDVLILPTSIKGSTYYNLSLSAISTLLGLPCISFTYLGCGLQLIAAPKQENKLLTAWEVAKQ